MSAHLLEDADHTRTAESEVVLQSDSCSFDLPLAGLTAQLPDQFGALGKTGGAEGVAL